MAKPNVYTKEASLVLAIVFFVNSALLFFDHFLSPYLANSAALASTTLCYIAFTHFAKPSESFESVFWSSFSLMAAHLSTSGDSIAWDLYRGRLLVGLGFTILALHTIFMWCKTSLSRPSDQQEQVPEKPGLPLHIELSFQFIGNGIAMAARSLIPGGSLVLMLVGSAVMLCLSLVCFYKYCKAASVSSRSRDHIE